MPRLFFSLRWRLMCAFILLTVLTAGGMWWFSRRDTLDTTVYIVESALTQLTGFIEEEVRAGHALTVQSKINALDFNRAYLWDEGVQLDASLALLVRKGLSDEEIFDFLRDWRSIPLNVGTRFGIYEKQADGSVTDVLSGEIFPFIPTDKSTSVHSVVTKLPQDGLLVIFRDSKGVLSLGAFMPCSRPGWTLAVYRDLKSVESGSAQLSEAITNRARQLIRGVTILRNGFLAAVDGKGTIQAIHCDAKLPESVLLAAVSMDTRHAAPNATVLVPDENMEYRIVYIRPFDWRLIIAVPLGELQEPARDLTTRLIKLTCIAILIGICASFFMSNKIIQPLRHFSELAKRLPSKNMLELNPQSLSQKLPIHRNDELGNLARSFEYMAHELHRNVTSLVEASAARERLQVELNVAREIQEGILPKIFPPYPERRELDLFATSEPAKEVGGDLYDFFFVDENRLCLVIGDVSDKGVPAALYMSITVTLVRVAMQEVGISPEKALERVNFNLLSDSTKGMFVTLLISILDLTTGELAWASAGHPPPFVLRAGGIECPESAGDLVAGAMPDINYHARTLQLQHGDALFFYTDGVSEAMNAESVVYGESYLSAFLADRSTLSMQEIITSVREDMTRHMDGAPPSDDITMLAVRFMPHTKGNDTKNV